MKPSVTRSVLLAGSLLAAALGGPGCTDDSGNGAGNPGAAGASGGGTGGGGGGSSGTGSGGTTGSAGTGGAGGTAPKFMAVPPCNAESDYMTGTATATVSFPTSATNFSYSPKCLKVPTGATVTFSGDFVAHPLEPSTHRGTLTGSPITATSSGSTKAFAFPTAGYYAYFCSVHGPSDGAAGMVGVVWVE